MDDTKKKHFLWNLFIKIFQLLFKVSLETYLEWIVLVTHVEALFGLNLKMEILSKNKINNCVTGLCLHMDIFSRFHENCGISLSLCGLSKNVLVFLRH